MTRDTAAARRRAWDEAHAAWLRGAEPASAGAELPGSAPLALRALDVLERDDEAGALSLLDEAIAAGATGVAVALGVALARAEDAEGHGRLRSGSVVVDDLAAAMQKWLRGGRPRGSRALQAGVRGRAVAASVRTLLAKRGARTLALPAGIRDWTRARALILALWGVRQGGRESAEQLLAQAGAHELDLDRYPGLDAPATEAAPQGIRSWLQGDAWSNRAESALAHLIERPPRDGDALLARILDRLHTDLAAGWPAPVLEAIPLVAELACRLDHHDLEADVRRLEGRLTWAADGSVPRESLVHLWSVAEAKGEPPAALVEVARRLLDAGADAEVSPEAALCLLRWGREEGLRMRVAMGAPVELTSQEARRALRSRDDLAPGEVEWLEGLLAVRRGDVGLTLVRGTELLEAGVRPDRACDLLLAAWPNATRRGAKRRLRSSARGSVGALAAVGRVDLETAHRLGASLALLRGELRGCRGRVERVALDSIPADLPGHDPDAGHVVALQARLLGLEAARPWLRRIGRSLRALAPEQADELALRTLSRLLQWEPIPLEGAQARAARPLGAWFAQAGPERVLAAAEAVAAGPPAVSDAWAAVWLMGQHAALGLAKNQRWSLLVQQLAAGARAAAYGLRGRIVDRILDQELAALAQAGPFGFDLDLDPAWDPDVRPIPF